MKEVKVSIVVPIYKVEKYLNRCLDSLVNQTLNDIEIICVNDGSPDNCLNIIKDYKEKYGDKIVIVDKKNEGLWKARIDGFKNATGEYIGFLDSDDYVKLDFVEKLYNKAKKENADICVCGYERIDDITGKVYCKEMCRSEEKVIDIQKEKGELLEINTAPWNKIYKKELFKNVYELENIPTILEDTILLQFLYTKANKMVFVNESLLNYMVREGSNINTVQKERIESTYAAMKESREICAKNTPEFLDYYDANAFIHLGISFMLRLSDDKRLKFSDTIKENTKYLNEVFPNWRKNEYIKLSYVIKHGGSNLKPWIVKVAYNLGMFRLFINFYKFVINKIGIDIKW